MKCTTQTRFPFASALALFFIALTVSPATAQLPAGTWQYLWGDEFTLSTLDSQKWINAYPWGRTHNHDAYMAPENVILGDGTLTLRAQRLPQGGKPFTSGAISTGYSLFRLNGGYIEARIRLPNTPGSWPAFWGLDNGWPPEADIMEYPIDTAAGAGYAQDQYHTAFHYRNTSGGNSAGAGQVNPSTVGDLGGSYHNFGMEWRDNDWVGFYFDGQLVSQFGDDAAVAQMTSMYLILNYAVGGWPGAPNLTEWPTTHTDDMKVDWVRVWKQAATRTTNWAYTGTSEHVQWDTAGNWSNGSPNLGGVTANFGTVPGLAEQRLDWSGMRTISTINLDGATRYRIGWPDDRLILAGANASGSAAINVAATSTTDHEVRAELELFNTLAITNNSTQPLTLSGKIFGIGGVAVDGPGTVIFSNSTSAYLGSTIIDSGGQGPGIARVAATNPFGSGSVIIGQAGNATTGRLELTNNSIVPNIIQSSGRNNTSVGIHNLSGNNTLAGTVNLQVGGSNYIIQSDAGLLTLSGSAAGGLALQSLATGTRTITFQGAGDTLITGRIQNGSASPLSLVKLGTGRLTLTGVNTYTGPTSVMDGTLALAGATTKRFTALNIAENALVDLNTSSVVIDDTDLMTITSHLSARRILTSASGAGFAIGSMSNSNSAGAAIYPTFMGLAGLDGSETLLRYTRIGDLNLDGAVSIADFLALASNFNATTGATWQKGDVNYDGSITIADFLALAGNFGQSVSGEFIPITASDLAILDDFAASIGFSTVPEPVALGLPALATLALRRSRSRGSGGRTAARSPIESASSK
jgi:autotransporter-associated beta strand protein